MGKTEGKVTQLESMNAMVSLNTEYSRWKQEMRISCYETQGTDNFNHFDHVTLIY